jgi:hypothetical protein
MAKKPAILAIDMLQEYRKCLAHKSLALFATFDV